MKQKAISLLSQPSAAWGCGEGQGVLQLAWAGGTSHPPLLPVAARGRSERDALGRAHALQGLRMAPFLLHPFEMRHPSRTHTPGAAQTRHVPMGNHLLHPPALPPLARRRGRLPSPLASALSTAYSPPPPFRLTTGSRHQLLPAQHRPFSHQQVQAGRPRAPRQ